jgi:hypothetical protein
MYDESDASKVDAVADDGAMDTTSASKHGILNAFGKPSAHPYVVGPRSADGHPM